MKKRVFLKIACFLSLVWIGPKKKLRTLRQKEKLRKLDYLILLKMKDKTYQKTIPVCAVGCSSGHCANEILVDLQDLSDSAGSDVHTA